MPRTVISYSSKDRALVVSLADDLQALGHEVWFDAELTRTGGQKWWSNILANLRQCDLFIFALTPNSLSSEACKREYGYAYALHKRILPVMLESVDVAMLPIPLQEIQFLDYRERNAKQALALAATLNNLPPAQPLPDPLPPEPETPLPPLARLSQRLDAPSLNSSEQVEIVFELERLFNDPATHASAETLLRILYNREDLTNRVGDKIRAIVPDISGVQPRSLTPEFAQTTPTRNKAPGAATANLTRKHGLWLPLYFLVPVLVSLFLLAMASDPRVGYLSISAWLMPMAITVSIVNLIGMYGTWIWKKWGIYTLIVSFIFSALAFGGVIMIDHAKYSDFDPTPWYFASILALVVALGLLWLVLRNKWQYFEGQPRTILGIKF